MTTQMSQDELLSKIHKVTLIMSATKDFVAETEANGLRAIKQPAADGYRWDYLMGLLSEFNKMIIDSAGGMPEVINDSLI